jgi:hypothetical protein
LFWNPRRFPKSCVFISFIPVHRAAERNIFWRGCKKRSLKDNHFISRISAPIFFTVFSYPFLDRFFTYMYYTQIFNREQLYRILLKQIGHFKEHFEGAKACLAP